MDNDMNNAIYILLTHSGTAPGWLVQKATHFPYSHVMISLTPDCTALYSFGRRSLYNFLNGGFTQEHRDGRFFSYFSKTECCELEMPVTEAQYDAVCRILSAFAENAQMYKYDFFGCCLRYFHLKKTFHNRYTCSHFVAEVLQRADICTFPAGTMLARPADFMVLQNARKIYTGKLLDLPRPADSESASGAFDDFVE